MEKYMQKKTVQIYGPSFSNFVRTVMLVCEEKQILYSVGFEVNGSEVNYKSEEHFNLHPFGKLPVLIDGELTLPETASICRYLDANFNENTKTQLQPSNPVDKARHDALCATISIDIDKVLIRDYLLEFAFPKGENGQVRLEKVTQAQPQVAKTLNVIAGLLESHQEMLTGKDLTIADALLAPMLAYLSGLPAGFNLLPDYPTVEDYLAKLMKNTSCQKILLAKKFNA